MGKYEKKNPRKQHKGVIIGLILVVLAAAFAAFVLPRVSLPWETEPVHFETEGSDPPMDMLMTENVGTTADNTAPESETTGGTSPGNDAGAVEFPHQLGDGALEIESLFQFDGINPDCGNREGEKIAAMMIRNVSGSYLKSASIRAVLDDGSEILFSVSDLPAGKTALAFSVDNAALEDDRECTAFRMDAVFEEQQSMEGLSVSVDGTAITLTNETGREMTQISIFCHGVLGDMYYGGVTYLYTIASLPAGESETVTVAECMIGVADVAGIGCIEEK